MSTNELQLYNAFERTLGESNAKIAVKGIRNTVKDEFERWSNVLATKEDIFHTREDLHNEIVGSTYALRLEIVEVRDGLRQEMAKFKEEIRLEMADMRDSLRLEIEEVRDGLRQEIAKFKEEIRLEMAEFKEEIRQEMREFKEEIRQEIAGVEVKILTVKADLMKFMLAQTVIIIGLVVTLVKIL